MQHTLMYITDSKIRRNKIVYIKYNHVMPSMDQVNQLKFSTFTVCFKMVRLGNNSQHGKVLFQTPLTFNV